MSAARVLTEKEWADLRVRRWAVRAVGFGLLTIAGCAWLVRNEQPFWPAFAVQTLAAFAFVALILFSIWIGIVVGAWVGKLNGFLGFVVGLVLGAATFMFVGLFSTEIPVLGPAIERVVSLIE
jgi:hypothetical protein